MSIERAFQVVAIICIVAALVMAVRVAIEPALAWHRCKQAEDAYDAVGFYAALTRSPEFMYQLTIAERAYRDACGEKR